MQGRLTPPEGRGIQFFPFENWENEFYTAKRLGLDDIEFIFDYENYTQNPLWTTEGRDRIRNVVAKTNVQVPAVCFDYFMRRPFYKAGSDREGLIRDENSQIIRRVFDAMKELDIGLIEIPLVDDSSLKNDLEKRIQRLAVTDSGTDRYTGAYSAGNRSGSAGFCGLSDGI